MHGVLYRIIGQDNGSSYNQLETYLPYPQVREVDIAQCYYIG